MARALLEALEESKQRRLNLAAYYSNFAVTGIVGLIVSPFILSSAGAGVLGAWRGLGRLMDFGSVSDGRSAQALKWVLADARGSSSDIERRRLLGAGIQVWLRMLPIVIAVSLVLVLVSTLTLADENTVTRSDVAAAAIILAISACINGLLWLPDSALVAENRGYLSTTLTTFWMVVSGVGSFAVLLVGWGLVGLAAALLVGSVLNGLTTWWLAQSKLSWWGIDRPSRSDVGRVFQFSGWTLVWAATEKLLLAGELLFVIWSFGAELGGHYSIMTFQAQFLMAVCLVTVSASAPSIGSLLGSGAVHDASKVANKSQNATVVIACAGALWLATTNELFVSLWVGDTYFMGAETNLLLAISALQLIWIRSDSQLADTTLDIAGRVRVLAVVSVVAISAAIAVSELSGSVNCGLAVILLVRLGPAIWLRWQLNSRFERRLRFGRGSQLALVFTITTMLLAERDLVGPIPMACLGAVASLLMVSVPHMARVLNHRRVR